MDLFLDIQNFQRDHLRKTTTLITREDGKVLTEKQIGDKYSSEVCGTTRGYVLDTKPDLQVAVILSGLILASQDVAQDLNILKSNKITHILNLAYGQPNHFPNHFIYKKINIRDDPEENIKLYFDECFHFIEEGLHSGCILVHCNAGISRAATIIIGYLIKFHKMKFQEAFQFVKKVRPSIRPNNGFIKQLKEYEIELNKNLVKE